MIQKNLIIILGTEPRILCSEVIRKNNSSMTQLNTHTHTQLTLYNRILTIMPMPITLQNKQMTDMICIVYFISLMSIYL